MPKYTTVNAYRAADRGIVGTAANAGISDLSLARTIADAESDVDAFYGFSLELNGGFEAHMTGLQQMGFDQSTRRMSNPASPVPIRNAQRYRIHISNAFAAGTGLFATIDPGDVVFNYAQGYVEIVPLTAITWSLAPAVWDFGLDPPIIEADYEVGAFLPAFGEALYNDAGDNKTFRALNSAWASVYTQAISNQPNQLPPIPPIVYVDSAPQAGTALTTALVSGVAVTALAVSALPAAVGGSVSLTLSHPVTGQTTTVATSGGGAAAGATSIPINSFTPTNPWPLGTYVANGYGVNFAEGLVTFGSSESGHLVTADYTYVIPSWVRDATIAQTTWLLALRQVAQMGALPYDLVKSGEQQVRRKGANTSSFTSNALCEEALHKLSPFKHIGIA